MRAARTCRCASSAVELPAEGNLQARGARRSLRAGRAARRGRLRRRAHRLRPGRDRALPAGGLARRGARCSGWRRAAGGSCGRCWRSRGRRCASTCRARGLDWRGGPLERGPALRPRARAPRGARRRCDELNPAAERTIAETAACCATRPRCWTRAVDEALDGARAAGRRSRCASWRELRRGSRGWCCAGWPSGRRRRARSRARTRRDPGAGRARRHEGARPRRRPAGGGRVRHAALHPRARRAGAARAGAPARCPGRARFGELGGGGRARRRRRGDAGRGRARRRCSRARLARRRPHAPAGLGGTKSLQDLFTDRKVPRALRRLAARGRGRTGDRVGGRRGRG